ncbi:hypothetical protein KR52_08955 [Synechococcus sp. KORDI-52]|nr:hypothetical protein KR52_08955 [Synechococcus sp. KORDI-52]
MNDRNTVPADTADAIPGVRCVVRGPPAGLGPMTAPVVGLFWTPYADWIYTVVSLSGLVLISWLVLGRSRSS